MFLPSSLVDFRMRPFLFVASVVLHCWRRRNVGILQQRYQRRHIGAVRAPYNSFHLWSGSSLDPIICLPLVPAMLWICQKLENRGQPINVVSWLAKSIRNSKSSMMFSFSPESALPSSWITRSKKSTASRSGRTIQQLHDLLASLKR